MDKKPVWMGQPVLDKDDVHALERRAAVLEFHHGVPRAKAEQQALDEYRKEQHGKAAAHHLHGMKASHALGNTEAAKQHHAMYEAHIKHLGLDATGAPPPEVARHMDAVKGKVYDFRQHGADEYLGGKPEPKEEPKPLAKGDVVPFPKERVAPAQDLGQTAPVVQGPQRGARVIATDNTHKAVKNLGWLLRNWTGVKHFELLTHPDGRGSMVAHLHDGRKFTTPWASHGVMATWLDRPKFRGVSATLDGKPHRIGVKVGSMKDPLFKNIFDFLDAPLKK